MGTKEGKRTFYSNVKKNNYPSTGGKEYVISKRWRLMKKKITMNSSWTAGVLIPLCVAAH